MGRRVGMIEKLEPRRLLSVTLSTKGILTINGTSHDDSMTLSLQDEMSIEPNGDIDFLPHLLIKNKNKLDRDVPVSKIHRIVIHLFRGNDSFMAIKNSGLTLAID